MSLQRRLSLAISVVLGLAFLAFGLVEYHTLGTSLLLEVDETLALRAHVLSEQIRALGKAKLRPEDLSELNLNADPLEVTSTPEIYVEVVDRQGKLLARSDNLGDKTLPVLTGLSHGHFETASVAEGLNLRLYATPVMGTHGQAGSVVVGESLHLVEVALRRAASAAVAGGLVTLFLVLWTVGGLLAQGLTPLAQVNRTAAHIIETGDVSQRVTEHRAVAEVAGVAASFNRMLARIENVLDSQSRFIADTSHELRNPLTVIQTDLDMLRQDLDGEEREEVVQEALREVQRMTNLVEDLMLLSWVDRQRTVRTQPVGLTTLAREAVERVRRQAEPRRLEVPEGTPEHRALGDPDRVRQILRNLLDNAIRHTPPGGRIEVRVEPGPGSVKLSVRDNGCGIDALHLSRLFDRFYRVDPSRSRRSGGAGLGLSIARALARLQGGDLDVESTLGEGTCFVLTLPSAKDGQGSGHTQA